MGTGAVRPSHKVVKLARNIQVILRQFASES
jgi:hypothetical protein